MYGSMPTLVAVSCSNLSACRPSILSGTASEKHVVRDGSSIQEAEQHQKPRSGRRILLDLSKVEFPCRQDRLIVTRQFWVVAQQILLSSMVKSTIITESFFPCQHV